jgi:hypothetical protein
MVRLVLAAAAAALLAGCSRPRPSPEYERARADWTALVQARGDAAPEDPAAGEVLALLARVPAESADAAAAAELRQRIEGERRARSEERARREKLVAAAGAPQAIPAPSEGGGGAAATSAERAARDEVASLRGEKLEDFRAARGDCFERRGPVSVTSADGGARPGELWALKPGDACREKYPALESQVVVFTDGALSDVAPAASVRTSERRERVALGALPDGGIGIAVDGGVMPIPPGATLEVDRPDGGQR